MQDWNPAITSLRLKVREHRHCRPQAGVAPPSCLERPAPPSPDAESAESALNSSIPHGILLGFPSQVVVGLSEAEPGDSWQCLIARKALAALRQNRQVLCIETPSKTRRVGI